MAFCPTSSLYVGGIGAWCATALRLVMGVHRLSPHSCFAPMRGYRRCNRSAVGILPPGMAAIACEKFLAEYHIFSLSLQTLNNVCHKNKNIEGNKNKV